MYIKDLPRNKVVSKEKFNNRAHKEMPENSSYNKINFKEKNQPITFLYLIENIFWFCKMMLMNKKKKN